MSSEGSTGKIPQRSIRTLKAGEVGIVDKIGAGRPAAKRLSDMGFVPGTRLEMVRPGTPCVVRINGRCIGLGEANQAGVLLRPAYDC